MRKKKKQVSTKKRLELLENKIASMHVTIIGYRLMFDPTAFNDLCKEMIVTTNSVNKMVNSLEGVEVAVAKLIPKESLELLQQFRNKIPNTQLDVSIL